MFERLEVLAPDPILGLLAAVRADPSPRKVDLGVGVYRDERGQTPVLAAVRAAERALLDEQGTKAYLGPAGNDAFNAALAALVLGGEHAAVHAGRVRSVQSVGGCGALRLGAELLHVARDGATAHVPSPTWANHTPLLGGAGLALAAYPYYDRARGAVDAEALLGHLRSLPAGDIVLLHGSCHNPTGADLSPEHWEALATVCLERGLTPFIDLAYQGLGAGLDEDALGARVLAQALPEVLIAVSCSKNFGLYRERTGALIVVAARSIEADAAASHLERIARRLYSMPPDHGAAVVARILGDPRLAALWHEDLALMRERIEDLRGALAAALARRCPERDFSALTRQRGMFSLLDLSRGAIERLRAEQHIYMGGDGRINLAGLREADIDFVARALASALRS